MHLRLYHIMGNLEGINFGEFGVLIAISKLKPAILYNYYVHPQWHMATDSPANHQNFAICQNFSPP